MISKTEYFVQVEKMFNDIEYQKYYHKSKDYKKILGYVKEQKE